MPVETHTLTICVSYRTHSGDPCRALCLWTLFTCHSVAYQRLWQRKIYRNIYRERGKERETLYYHRRMKLPFTNRNLIQETVCVAILGRHKPIYHIVSCLVRNCENHFRRHKVLSVICHIVVLVRVIKCQMCLLAFLICLLREWW